MTAYMVVLVVSILVLKKLGPDAPVFLLAVLVLSPIVPIIFFCLAMYRFIRDCDELERRIELESIALSCLFTGILFMAVGFLAGAEIIIVTGATVALWVFPVLCGLYGITKCIHVWRYR